MSRARHHEEVFGELPPLPKSEWPIVDLLSELDGEDYREAFGLPPKPQSQPVSEEK